MLLAERTIGNAESARAQQRPQPEDLSSSWMVGTNFSNAELEDADLSSSNLRDVDFRGANLPPRRGLVFINTCGMSTSAASQPRATRPT